MDFSAISAIATSLRTAGDIAKAMLDLRDAQAFRAKAIELTGEIMTAQGSALAMQAAQAALIARIGDLEEKLMRMETWNAEKQRYQLHALAPGTFAYLVQEPMRGPEPVHAICANCYQSGVKSILQIMKDSIGQAHIDCPRCQYTAVCFADGSSDPLLRTI